MSQENGAFLKLHSIQLHRINIVELAIKMVVHPDETEYPDEYELPFNAGHSDFNKEQRRIDVMVEASTSNHDEGGSSKEEENPEQRLPFNLKIVVVGEFHIGEDFPDEYIYDWARKNAPLILMPYVREQAFALTARCGYKPMLLPLVEVPTLVFNQKQEQK